MEHDKVVALADKWGLTSFGRNDHEREAIRETATRMVAERDKQHTEELAQGSILPPLPKVRGMKLLDGWTDDEMEAYAREAIASLEARNQRLDKECQLLGSAIDKTRIALSESEARVRELETVLGAIANGVIVPPLMTEQARQLMQWQDLAQAAINKESGK